jgi:hypothetical protein
MIISRLFHDSRMIMERLETAKALEKLTFLAVVA